MIAIQVILHVLGVVAALLLLGALVGPSLGRLLARRAAEQTRPARARSLPAHLDPRDTDHANTRGHQLFTALLALVALVGMGFAGAIDVAAAGGVQ